MATRFYFDVKFELRFELRDGERCCSGRFTTKKDRVLTPDEWELVTRAVQDLIWDNEQYEIVEEESANA